MSYFINFFIALPSIGWGVVAALLLLWFFLHLYEGYILSGYHTAPLHFPYVDSVKRIKKLFKPAILFVAAAMALVALFSPNFLPKNSVDKFPVDAAQLESLDAEKASIPTSDRVPKPKQRDVFKHDQAKEKE